MQRLAREADKAAKRAMQNRFLIETYLSLNEARAGKLSVATSAQALFKRLGI